MTPNQALPPPPAPASAGVRKPRLLWANCYCLLDTSSGAAMSVRQMLLQLAHSGYEVAVLGCTVFDHERGTAGMTADWAAIKEQRGKMVRVVDGPLKHQLLVTADTRRGAMAASEHTAWFGAYLKQLAGFKPDLVLYYGGQPADLLISFEARLRGIPVAFYLVNANYHTTIWCRDVDLVLTDSHATAGLYKQRFGLEAAPLGNFIDAARVLATKPARQRVLFVNPKLQKGAAIVAMLALMLEERRPDIVFEVVEQRGAWAQALQAVTKAAGKPRDSLANVVVTPTTADMRPIYGRARLLLAPSLGWESAGRVAAEAMLNGIPALVSDRGGLPQTVGQGGILLRFSEEVHQPPYNRLPPLEVLAPIAALIETLYDDEERYAALCRSAAAVGRDRHHIDVSTRRLLQALEPLAQRRAGDTDAPAALRQWHRHGLDERPPEPAQHTDTP
ncbi:MAG TPA: glycosyltransferase family 4 protein [Ramlibacter sp.]|nr:glycosyltransferase family 4 protein [Ramlibacter sp.]